MMSFGGNSFFAPESMLTRDGRRIMWAWLYPLPIHPSGVQSLPRELELPEDGVLRIRPLRELVSLRHDPVSRAPFTLPAGGEEFIEEISGDAIEIELSFAWPLPQVCGIDLLADADGNDGLRIAVHAGEDSIRIGSTQAPFELYDGEDLSLRVFIDKNLVEVFINDRQAVVQAAPHIRAHPNVRIFAEGGAAAVESLKAWKMKSIYVE
jgi:beta-fructofuranosidase